jgi:toxin ParE1/3/4
MVDFRLRPLAVHDLAQIWDDTIQAWDEEQAERYLRLINESFLDLAENPSLGRSCDSIRPGYRRPLGPVPK